MMVDFDKYDVIHLGVSGGKDSTAVLLWLIYESDIDHSKIDVSFCDTGNEDWFTYQYLEMLSREVFPITTIFPPMDFWELAKHKKRFPSRRARFCTSELKIKPSLEYVKKIKEQGKTVLMLNGVRKTEGHSSNNRGDVLEFGFEDMFQCDVYRPILKWTLDDVWDITKSYLGIHLTLDLIKKCDYLDHASNKHFEDTGIKVDYKQELIDIQKKHRIPRNPLYDMGSTRVGCFPCINSRKAEIRGLAKYNPLRIDFLEEQENSTGKINPLDGKRISTFFARNTIPLAHRTKEIVTAKEEVMKVPTIRDVVRWSQTAYGGKQYEMDLPDDEFNGCLLGGYCE